MDRRSRYSHIKRDKHVPIKHLETKLGTVGYFMIVGKHGDMQWIGKLSSFTNDLRYICSTINYNLQLSDFRSNVSDMSIMD